MIKQSFIEWQKAYEIRALTSLTGSEEPNGSLSNINNISVLCQ